MASQRVAAPARRADTRRQRQLGGAANGNATTRLKEMDIGWRRLSLAKCSWWAKLDTDYGH